MHCQGGGSERGDWPWLTIELGAVGTDAVAAGALPPKTAKPTTDRDAAENATRIDMVVESSLL